MWINYNAFKQISKSDRNQQKVAVFKVWPLSWLCRQIKISDNLLNSNVTFEDLSFHVKRNIDCSGKHVQKQCTGKSQQISPKNCNKIAELLTVIKYNLNNYAVKGVSKERSWTCKHYCTYMEIRVTAQVHVGSCFWLRRLLFYPSLPLPLALYPRGCPSPTCQPAPHDFKSCYQIWSLLLPWDIDHLYLRHKDRVENFGKCCVWYNNIQWRSCNFEVFLKTLSPLLSMLTTVKLAICEDHREMSEMELFNEYEKSVCHQ